MVQNNMMHPLVRTFLDFILPPKDDVRVARAVSEETLRGLLHPTLVKEMWIISLFPYRNGNVRSLVRSVKFYGETGALNAIGAVVGEFLLEMISEKKLFSGWNTPLLIPIPASGKRLKERGYNQAERIAESLLPFLEGSILYAPEALRRNERESQVRIERKEREKNIAGAFFVPDAGAVSGKQILLIDDVVESGATLKDARRALRAAGASEVIGVALAH